MNTKTDKVFKGYLRLTSQEKRELVAVLNNYINESLSGQKSIVERADIGPIASASCPCCGR